MKEMARNRNPIRPKTWSLLEHPSQNDCISNMFPAARRVCFPDTSVPGMGHVEQLSIPRKNPGQETGKASVYTPSPPGTGNRAEQLGINITIKP